MYPLSPYKRTLLINSFNNIFTIRQTMVTSGCFLIMSCNASQLSNIKVHFHKEPKLVGLGPARLAYLRVKLQNSDLVVQPFFKESLIRKPHMYHRKQWS